MAKTIGSVSIDGSGNATGSGITKSIYDRFIASPVYSNIPGGASGVPAKEQLADFCAILAPSVLDIIKFDLTPVKTSAYTAAFYEVVLCNCSGGGFTVTLPNISSDDVGGWVIVKKSVTSGNVLVVDGNGSDTIDSAASQNMAGSTAANLFVALTTSTWGMMSWT